MKFKKTPYLVLFVILIAVSMSGAYALTITLGADIIEILGILDMNNNRITNVGSPQTTTDAATKAYVDSSPSGGTDTLALLGCDMDQVPRWDGSVWVCSTLGIEDFDVPSTVDDGNVAGQYSSIAIGADNNPVISYRQIVWLKVVHCGKESCSAGNTITTVDNSGDVCHY